MTAPYINPAILKLRGITQPFIDSLLAASPDRIRVIDTLSTVNQDAGNLAGSKFLLGSPSGGWFHNDTVEVNPRPEAYTQLLRDMLGDEYHPPGTANPRGVLAHEIGHSDHRGMESTADKFSARMNRIGQAAQGSPKELAARLQSTHAQRDIDPSALHELRNQMIRQEAPKFGVPTNLALAISNVENTRGLPWAVSSAGAVGLMQVIPHLHKTTADEMANPQSNVMTGLSILRSMYDRYGSWEKALRAYNGALDKPEAGDAYVNKIRNALSAQIGRPAPSPISTAAREWLDRLALARHAQEDPRFTESERSAAQRRFNAASPR